MVMEKNAKTFIKCSLKVTLDYLIALIIFGIFVTAIMGLAKENLSQWMMPYSILIFLILFAILYSDMKDIAFREKRPQYNINPGPYKGLLFGLAGMAPLMVIALIYPFISVAEDFVLLKFRVIQAFTAPMFWLAKLMGGVYLSYVATLLTLPLIAMLGYLAGHRDFELMFKIKTAIKKVTSKIKFHNDEEDE